MPANEKGAQNAEHKKKPVSLSISYGKPNYRWQMLFNSFEIERLDYGVMVRVAFVYSRPGYERTAAEIVPFIISNEGLEQLKETSKKYVTQFGTVAPLEQPPLPAARQFSPLFANHVRLARSGGCAEIALYTVPLMEVAAAARGQRAEDADVECVQVGLLHSDTLTHERLVLGLLS